MPRLTSHVYRGESFLRVEGKVPTSDVTQITTEAKQETKRYTRDQKELSDEGFQAAIIAHTVESKSSGLTYGIALIYDYERAAWALEVTDVPDFAKIDHRRRPRRGKGKLTGNQRLMERVRADCIQFMRDSLDAFAAVLYRMVAAGARLSPVLATFLADMSTMRSMPLLRRVLYISKLSNAARPKGRLNDFLNTSADNRLRDRSDLMRHVRVWVNGQPQPAQAGGHVRSASQDWDLALFGSL